MILLDAMQEPSEYTYTQVYGTLMQASHIAKPIESSEEEQEEQERAVVAAVDEMEVDSTTKDASIPALPCKQHIYLNHKLISHPASVFFPSPSLSSHHIASSSKCPVSEIQHGPEEDADNVSRSRRPHLDIDTIHVNNTARYTWPTYKSEFMAGNLDSDMDHILVLLRILQDVMSIIEPGDNTITQYTMNTIARFTEEPTSNQVYTLIEYLAAMHPINSKYTTRANMWCNLSNHGMRGVGNTEDVYSQTLMDQMNKDMDGPSSSN